MNRMVLLFLEAMCGKILLLHRKLTYLLHSIISYDISFLKCYAQAHVACTSFQIYKSANYYEQHKDTCSKRASNQSRFYIHIYLRIKGV